LRKIVISACRRAISRKRSAEEGRHLLLRRRCGREQRADLVEYLLRKHLLDLVEQILLRADVVVEARLLDPDRHGDVVQRRVGVPVPRKELDGVMDDLLARARLTSTGAG
jgi:hypothetical protein